MENGKSPKDPMTIKQLSQYLQIGLTKAYQLVWTHEIPASPVGNRWRITKANVDKYLEDRCVRSAEDHAKLTDGRRK